MSLVALQLPRRNTQSHWVTLFDVQVLFSYTTPIAFHAPGVAYRRRNDWGPTTGRHMKEELGGSFDIVEETEFERHLEDAIVKGVARNERVLARLAPKIADSVTRKLVPEIEHAVG